MYAYFRGKLVSVSQGEALLEVSGIAYRFLVSTATARSLPGPGAEAIIYSHLSVREDALQLYGFSAEEERQLFLLLLSASGVGPKLALAVLSGLPVEEVHEAIIGNAPERLYGITGVGKKTAARIILELRDKILKLPPSGSRRTTSSAAAAASGAREDAVDALVTLGFPAPAARTAVAAVLEKLPQGSVEEIVKAALSSMHSIQGLR